MDMAYDTVCTDLSEPSSTSPTTLSACTDLAEPSSTWPTRLSAPTLLNHHRHRLLHCLHRPYRIIVAYYTICTDLVNSAMLIAVVCWCSVQYEGSSSVCLNSHDDLGLQFSFPSATSWASLSWNEPHILGQIFSLSLF